MSLSGFNHNLHWSEFREVNQRPGNVSEDAEITIAFRPNYQFQSLPNQNCRVTSITTRITVSRSESWVVKGRKSAGLLQHELGHYDITALGAREIHQRISVLTVAQCSGINTEAQRIQQEVQLLIHQVNTKYDRETNHGVNSAVQTTWETSIRRAKQSPSGTLANLP